jgi:hypothetical protein
VPQGASRPIGFGKSDAEVLPRSWHRFDGVEVL